MAFNEAVVTTPPDLMPGEFIAASPYNCSAFDVWEEGLIPGRFVKYDAGSIDLLDTSATPVIAGVVRRKISSALENLTYTKLGIAPDQVAEIVNFGFVSVEVLAGDTPARFQQVYAVNTAGANLGKATETATNNAIVPGCVFWEAKRPGTWLVLIPKYLTGV
jgi:hypothetical protein